jgi:hypothetical protein
MKSIEFVGLKQFIESYSSSTLWETPEHVYKQMMHQNKTLHPDGWLLLSCKTMDSNTAGAKSIRAYGPNCQIKEIPLTAFAIKDPDSLHIKEVQFAFKAKDFPEVFPAEDFKVPKSNWCKEWADDWVKRRYDEE